jgi:hypothetical protein
MGNKIQGEGDYEAGRRFQEEEHEFVKRKYGKRKPTDLDPDREGMDLDLDSQDGRGELDDDLGDADDTQIADNRDPTRGRQTDRNPQHRR